MLEDFIPGAAAQLRAAAPLGGHLDALCASLFKQGYRPQTVREKVRTIARLSRWMTAKRLDVNDLDERCVEQFGNTQRRRGVRHTLLQLMDHLRTVGVLPSSARVSNDSHSAALPARYAEYLSRERGLAVSTIKY